MKYVRTKDGRIVEESKLEPGLKQTFITITRKNDNKELAQINVDYSSDYIDMVTVCEYCKCHRINPKDIKYEITTLFNDVLKQADTIKELCDEFVMISDGKHKLDIGCHSYGDKKIQIYGAIWTDKGLIYVAEMNEKGCLELL